MNPSKGCKKLLLSLYHYFCFFMLMTFLISCCMMLFLSIMAQTMHIEFTEGNIKSAAIITFGNVVFLSLVCTSIDAMRRKLTVDKPVKQIVAAAEKIARGDYSVRIPRLSTINRTDGLNEIIDCYNKMAEELAGIESLQTDFIANVSHELKTPLTVIQNYGTLLQQPDLSEKDRLRYAKAASDAARRLSELITNILKLSKIENQQIYSTAEDYELNEQLCACLLRFETVWEDKNITIETAIDEVHIHADPELLSIVWNNLFSNALKFTEKDGTVRVTLREDCGTAIVTVSDTGCGISPQVGKRIFDKFYQADTSHRASGNGLGLALVRRVINIMNGEISVQSEVGKGSTFTVRLKGNGYEDR